MKVYVVVGVYGQILGVYTNVNTANEKAEKATRANRMGGSNEIYYVIDKDLITD